MRNIALYFMLGLGFTSCADFMDYPLDNKSISLAAPAPDLVSTDSVLTFWWDSHEDATAYRLQVVRGNFDSPKTLVVDSLLVHNQLKLTLDSGSYAWRVRPENSGSVGLFAGPRRITIMKK